MQKKQLCALRYTVEGAKQAIGSNSNNKIIYELNYWLSPHLLNYN